MSNLNNDSYVNKLKVSNGFRISNGAKASSYIKERKEKKHYIYHLQMVKDEFDEKIFNHMMVQINHGKLKPKYDSESWSEYLTRITPFDIHQEVHGKRYKK